MMFGLLVCAIAITLAGAVVVYLGLIQDICRFAYVRKAANLWWLNEQLWQDVLRRVPHDEHFAILP